MRKLHLGALAVAASLASTQVRAQDAVPPTPTAPEVAAGTDVTTSGEAAPVQATGLPPVADTQDTASSNELPMELSAQELAALGLSDPSSGVDTSIKLSGFMDFTFSGQKVAKDSFFRLSGAHPSFYMGSINLYVSKNITDSVRTFLEVRFSYLPNGTSDASGQLISTAAADYNDAGRPQRWGGTILQRAYLEWMVHPSLILRVGQYLTPYGIWNVDHGSPTIVTVLRPYIIGSQLFPERQTGVQAFGRYSFTTHNALNYALTVSNGFGPISEYRDLDNNKAVGGHFNWTNDGLGEFRLGGSWFYGRDTNASQSLLIRPDGTLGSREQVKQQSDVLSLSADLRWKWSNLMVQAEVITQQRRFTSNGSVGAPAPAAGNQVLAPKDALSWGTYGIVGYRFSWLGVMPYVLYTYNTGYDASSYSFGKASAAAAGLNIRPIDSVVLKLEYLTLKLLGRFSPSDERAHILQAQLAWAF